jgi:uncharacterized iron-regulated membrane protein
METLKRWFYAICQGAVWGASVTISMLLMGAVIAMIMLMGGVIYLITRLKSSIEKYGFMRP